MAKRLKKTAAPKAPKGQIRHPIEVRFGSGADFGEWRGYPTESKARQAIVKELDALQPWLRMHNIAGLEAIHGAKTEIDAMTFHVEPQRIVCSFDEHYQMKLVVEYRRRPDA